ncbi:28 kDa heat- and acid-stable phosphoprotein-like [Stegodyphus dumicola]|uniref:28 kDa heat- and acid-stable phosphoprotein-like n=1 Tax=Stegodyphus dumicola TaxID=202533 RepID=UPI0015AFD15D|nr:28 kDa heat- and acid-stable phosphoprotein-like [Stegodyphus dumicola]
MPKGRGRGGSGHKGQRRHFTNPDQLAQSKEKKEKERQWRQQRGELSSDEESDESKGSSSSSEEEEESDTEEEKQAKAKGVQHLIEIENPNRVVKKEKKVEELKLDENAQLSRREREELEKQRAKMHYQKMHAAGKTNEAKADLARLAIIKKQREEAAKRREEEIKAKQEAEKAKATLTKKALGKRT